MRLTLLAILALAVAGCVGPSVVVMKNPATGQLVQCGSAAPAEEWMVGQTAKDCASGYQAAGWQRMN